jgi:hypothetical protein
VAARRSGDGRSAGLQSATIERAISGAVTTPHGSGGIGIAAVAEQIP